MSSRAATNRPSTRLAPRRSPIGRPPSATPTRPTGAVATPLLLVLVVAVCLGSVVLAASSPRAIRDVGATVDRILAETIEDWLDIDTFDLPGLRPENHPVRAWLEEMFLTERAIVVLPGAEPVPRAGDGRGCDDATSSAGCGHRGTAVISRDTAIW